MPRHIPKPYTEPRSFTVLFETGYEHEVMATSFIDAKNKSYQLQDIYGEMKVAYLTSNIGKGQYAKGYKPYSDRGYNSYKYKQVNPKNKRGRISS